MVVPASITSIEVSLLWISACISLVSRAAERLLTTDWLPESASRISTRLLMLLEEGNKEIVPLRVGVREMVRVEVKRHGIY